MQSMVTITHNNRCAEMLAVVRRGPFARPTSLEKIEHLLTRVSKSGSSVAFADHALEHTLSFQRRVHSIKAEFLRRCAKTPLGITHDYWDRTEAQQRGALHSHILVWFRKRRAPPHWSALPVVPRTVNGTGPKQRHGLRGQDRPPPQHQQIQHDSCYHLAEMGRVSAEMVRPIVTPGDFGGYDVEMLRMASLSRTILIRLNYLHICSPVYCLKVVFILLNRARIDACHFARTPRARALACRCARAVRGAQDRSTCRFFFPWPCQAQQCYDANTERVALQRRLPGDDLWVVRAHL